MQPLTCNADTDWQIAFCTKLQHICIDSSSIMIAATLNYCSEPEFDLPSRQMIAAQYTQGFDMYVV